MRAIRYDESHARDWDTFLDGSKNGLFLFKRGYMDYHRARFEDHSLIFSDDNDRWVAVLPASRHGDGLISHGGLTFGGMVCTSRMTTTLMLRAFDALRCYAKSEGIGSLRYKVVPHMYHRLPAEEDLYALFLAGAKVFKREVTSVIDMRQRLPLSKGRKTGISKARRSGVVVRETTDFATFMAIEEQVLSERHNARPTHTISEIELLANRFPGQIRLFAAFLDDEMCAGAVIYAHERVVHAQYLASNHKGRECGALDLLICQLLDEVFAEAPYFDFGISTESNGTYLNVGLIAQKEMFGGRTMIHETLDLNLT